ncbi:MAG TPA: nuclease-related domain-containing protein [Methylomirabilota bacterium]|nr:nuclease-related domain-containing protein [Methylomirabilota bacterium]
MCRSGLKGEAEAAYHIDFHLKQSPNWMVIHDLRIERSGRVAQIDHLVISRLLEVYVVESKNLKTKVRYQNGGWERLDGKEWHGLPCPVEQNVRHIAVLKELVQQENLAPPRLGLPVPVSYKNVVALNPSCSIVGEFPDDARVVRMDRLVREMRDDDRGVMTLVTLLARETIEGFARKLVGFHQPAATQARASTLRSNTTTACEACGSGMTKAEEFFCRMNKQRFAGRALCRKCQGYAPKAVTPRSEAAQCGECGAGVESKVATYCLSNRRRFAGRTLCRKCQNAVPV